MKLHEKILNDKKYLKAMEKIDEVCTPDINIQYDSWHGISHAKGVMSQAVDFLKRLGESEQVIELAKVAALLHDIALQDGHKGDHAKIGAKMAKEYLDKLDLSDKDKKLIQHAICFHSRGEEIDNNLDAAILVGDKLDINYARVRFARPNGINEYMMLIDKIEYILDEKIATLKYTVKDGFDVKCLSEWPKAVTIPAKVAQWLGKDFIFEFSDKKLTEQEFLKEIK
jgi:HD superfamily phosphohydrolase YqeK